MSRLKINNVDYYYEEVGSGDEILVFSHGFLWSSRMFAKQVEVLKENYRIITYDHRGQGQTEVTMTGYDMDTLTDDAVQLIHELNANPCHFIGLSMGGYVGMRLASRYPELLKSLILLETRADPEPFLSQVKFRILGLIGRYVRSKAIAQGGMQAMFGRTFMNDPDRANEREFWLQQIMDNNPVGTYRALMGVITRKGVYDELSKITLPTLIMVGDEDTATVPAKAQEIHEAIPHSHLVIIRQAGHTSVVEEPEQVITAMKQFLAGLA